MEFKCLPCFNCSDEDAEEEIESEKIRDILQCAQNYCKEKRSVEECRDYILNHFEVDDINFYDSKFIDEFSYGKGGNYWAAAYGNPKENDVIADEKGNFIGIANNVGMFTFQIIHPQSPFV